MSVLVQFESNIAGFSGEGPWERFNEFPPRVYQCGVVVIPDPDGGFSVHATNLPGAVSQGETVEEALSNITEALEGLISEYIACGPIPWCPVAIEGVPVCEKRILVNV